MGESLIFLVNDLPLLLKSCNQFIAFLFIKQELLLVTLVFFLDLHLSHELVFVFDLTLDLLEELRYLSISLFFQVVFLSISRELWGYELY
jgi:hypothetical protein